MAMVVTLSLAVYNLGRFFGGRFSLLITLYSTLLVASAYTPSRIDLHS